MRELTLQEMDHVAGGNFLDEMFKNYWSLSIEYIWNHKEEYFNYWLQCIGQYPAGPYDYRLAGS